MSNQDSDRNKEFHGETLEGNSRIDEIDRHSNIYARVARTTIYRVDIGSVAAHELLATPK